MFAGHRINHVAVRMWAQHLPHSIASAKRQVTCGVKLAVSAVQDYLRRPVTIVTLHHRKQIEKESGQRQSVALCCFSSEMTQPRFRERKNDVWFESFYCRFQCCVGCQWPDEIFVIGDPCCQLRTESALS